MPVPIFCVLPISTRTEPLPDLLEEGLFLGVGFGVADGGDLLAGNAVGDQLVDDVVVGASNPRASD